MTDGLVLHLDADTLTQSNGATVSSWASTNDPTLVASQLTDANQPLLIVDAINGNNAVRFDGLNDRLQLSQNLFSTATLPMTLFTVLETDDYQGHVIGTGSATGGTLTTSGFGLGVSANKPFLKSRTTGSGVWLLSPGNLRQSGPQILAGTVSNAASQLRTACHLVETTTAPNPANLSPTQIGSTLDGMEALAGDIAEILVYNRVLTAQEQTDVLAYLADRYGAPVSAGLDSDGDGVFDECDTGSVYLKGPEITVELLAPEALTSGSVVENIINAESATSFDPHTRETHVEAARSNRIELMFDLQGIYHIETVHFWNYLDENISGSDTIYNWDIDEMTYTFYDSANEEIADIDLTPQSGYEGILPEDFSVDVPGVRYIRAELRGDSNNTEFMNIGFTGIPESTTP